MPLTGLNTWKRLCLMESNGVNINSYREADSWKQDLFFFFQLTIPSLQGLQGFPLEVIPWLRIWVVPILVSEEELQPRGRINHCISGILSCKLVGPQLCTHRLALHTPGPILARVPWRSPGSWWPWGARGAWGPCLTLVTLRSNTTVTLLHESIPD